MICVRIYIVRSVDEERKRHQVLLPDGMGVLLGREPFDLDVGIVSETCLGELHAAFGIGAS